MAAYRRFCDSRHLQADYQEPDQPRNPTSMDYLYLYGLHLSVADADAVRVWYRGWRG